MHSFEVRGGKKLNGAIIPQGAKNEALQIISAVLLTPEEVTISNIPDIIDVNLLIELLGEMNVKVNRISRDTCIFRADDVNIDYLHSEAYKKKSGRLRGSVMLAGPMLARFRKAFIPKPGGDKIGRRRLDTHIIGFEKLGASFIYHEEDGFFHLDAPDLKGATMLLDEPSVTGRTIRYRYCQYRNGCFDGERNHHHLSCRLRALYTTALPHAEPHGRQNQWHRQQYADH